MGTLGINDIEAISYIDEEIKKIIEALKEKQDTETINKRRKELALKLGISPEHLDQCYPNYKQPEVEKMLYGKDVYRVLSGLTTGTFKKPRFNLKLEKINY